MAKAKSADKKRPNIVSVHLSDEAKQSLDDLCDARGMTIKETLGRLILFLVTKNATEQAVILGHVEESDVCNLLSIMQGGKKGKKVTS